MRYLSEDLEREVLAGLETELTSLLDADGLAITTEVNDAVTRR